MVGMERQDQAPVHYDLGCGRNKREGHIGVDIADFADLTFDLNAERWTFAEDASADSIFVSHFIEHVDSLINFMNECHRILKVGGQMTVIAPYYTSLRCWQDPTHRHAISEASFLYYNRQWREENGLEHYPITADFDFTYGFHIDPAWATRSEEARMFAIKHYNNVVTDIEVHLSKWR